MLLRLRQRILRRCLILRYYGVACRADCLRHAAAMLRALLSLSQRRYYDADTRYGAAR